MVHHRAVGCPCACGGCINRDSGCAGACQGMGASASRAADGLRAVWQQLAGDSTSPEMPSLARKVLTMLGDNQGTMRKVCGSRGPRHQRCCRVRQAASREVWVARE
jgi:hypothetical protein